MMTSKCQSPRLGYQLLAAAAHQVRAIVDLDRSHMKDKVEKHCPGSWDEDDACRMVADNIRRARVLTFQEQVVGTYYWWPEAPRTAVLHSVQIAPSHRNQGLGTWLIRCFEDDAKSAGLRIAGLAVFKGSPALRLYRRLGYEVTGTDGPNAVEMQKDLAKGGCPRRGPTPSQEC